MKRLRFNLGRGPWYKMWQIKYDDSDRVDYYNPDIFTFIIKNGTLNNKRKVAEKIYNGANKTVCAFISFNEGDFSDLNSINLAECTRIYYNPRICPHWTDSKNKINLDGYTGDIVINGKELYILQN